MGERFIVRRAAIWEDGWTYGNWRQYVAPRAGTTQCVRLSALPLHAAVLSAALVILLIMGEVVAASARARLNWLAIFPVAIVAAALGAFPLMLLVNKSVLVVAVGPLNRDGRRALHSDEVQL